MTDMTPRDSLADEPFTYRKAKDGLVQILHSGRIVTTLRGAEALKFISKVVSAEGRAAQLLMAKATGQFKFGNERMAKEKGKAR